MYFWQRTSDFMATTPGRSFAVSPWQCAVIHKAIKKWLAQSPELNRRITARHQCWSAGWIPKYCGKPETRRVSTALIWNVQPSHLDFFILLTILSISNWKTMSQKHFYCLLKIIPVVLLYHFFISHPKENGKIHIMMYDVCCDPTIVSS